MSGIQSVSVSAAQSYASVAPQSQPSLSQFSNLDLTETQRTQLRSIFSAAKQNGSTPSDVQQQVAAVLTPAQQQTLSGDIKAGHHHHHHESDSSNSSNSSSASDASSSTSGTSSPSASSSTDSTVSSLVSNVQNQSAAASSTLLKTLQTNVLSSYNVPPSDTDPADANG